MLARVGRQGCEPKSTARKSMNKKKHEEDLERRPFHHHHQEEEAGTSSRLEEKGRLRRT